MSLGENKRGEGIAGYLPLGIIKRKGKGIRDTFPLLVTPVRLELTTQ